MESTSTFETASLAIISSSAAPSRKFAVFVESDSQSPLRDDHFGFHIFFFRASDQKVIRLTNELRYDFEGFEWDEAAGHVLLRQDMMVRPKSFHYQRPDQRCNEWPGDLGCYPP
jgi:hypothetical protein